MCIVSYLINSDIALPARPVCRRGVYLDRVQSFVAVAWNCPFMQLRPNVDRGPQCKASSGWHCRTSLNGIIKRGAADDMRADNSTNPA